MEKLAQSHAPEAIDTILDLMRNSEIDRVRLAAAEAMLNRGLGKPRMRLDESVQHDASQSFIEALREINARPRIKVVDGEVVEVPNKG